MNPSLALEALARTLTVPTLLVLLATPVAAQDRCPYGHEVTGSIPILYGYPVFTPELEQALDRGELVLGGCEVSGDSPSHVAVCKRCGFRHEVDEIGPIWRRSSGDVASFEIPLPAFLLDVRSRLAPAIRTRRIEPSYEQQVRSGEVTQTSGGFEVEMEADRVVAVVREVVAASGLAAREVALEPDGLFLFQVNLSDPEHGGWITVRKRPRGRFFVGFAWAARVVPSGP